MKKDNSKTKPENDKELSPPYRLVRTLKNDKLPLKIFKVVFRHKRYWLLPLLIIAVIFFAWQLSQSWIFKSFVSQTETYPKASVLGTGVGNLNTEQLNNRLTDLKQEFENRKVTLVNSDEQWTFDVNKLGATIDVNATSQAVQKLNSLSLMDKYRLMTGSINSVIEPSIVIDNDKCAQALSEVSITQIQPADALIYFDKELQVKSDQPGNKFNAIATCQELSKQLASSIYTINVQLDVAPANITKTELDAKLSQIQSMVGKALSLKSSSGTYRLDLTTEQLLALLDISKKDSDIQVIWSPGKLDELVNNIASQVNTSGSSPALGSCQYLVSSGGNWLDKEATKKIFTDIGADSPRSYDLPITYHAPIIGGRTPVAVGSKGTIYLTYDDGLTYANQIMDYASCYGIKVTFFELGNRVNTDAVALRRAIAEGHAVQSHGYEHAIYDYGDRSYDWQYNDISQSITAIMGITGVRPTYFRPPGGNRSANTYAAASANGVNLILWGDASRDSAPTGVTSALTCANTLAGAYPGASVLMHSTNKSSAEALPCIAEGLAARGYNMQALR